MMELLYSGIIIKSSEKMFCKLWLTFESCRSTKTAKISVNTLLFLRRREKHRVCEQEFFTNLYGKRYNITARHSQLRNGFYNCLYNLARSIGWRNYIAVRILLTLLRLSRLPRLFLLKSHDDCKVPRAKL